MARTTRYWCGYLEEPVPGRQRTYQKRVDTGYMHQDFFLTRKSFGVAVSWLRRWRYRLLLHRAFFQDEAELFRMMHGPHLLKRARVYLSDAWVRHIIWKRDAESVNLEELRERLLTETVEELIASSWHWYGPMMASRRQQQFHLSGDRNDILAIDGNAKLHRRTCGMPFAI